MEKYFFHIFVVFPYLAVGISIFMVGLSEVSVFFFLRKTMCSFSFKTNSLSFRSNNPSAVSFTCALPEGSIILRVTLAYGSGSVLLSYDGR